MKDCIILTPHCFAFGQTPKGKRNTYSKLYPHMAVGTVVCWKQDKSKSAACVWASTYDKRIYCNIPRKTLSEKIYDENNVLYVKSLAEIPDNYYEIMSVPITFGLYKWDDLEYIETNYHPTVNGKRVFSRYYVKRKNNTNEA